MAVYTAGELKDFAYVPESTYGTTPTTALTWGGKPRRIKSNNSYNVNFEPGASSRSFTDVTRGPEDAGFEIEYLARLVSGGYNWRNFAAYYAFGSTTALTDHLGSFTAQIKKTVGASNYYNFYSGCKINKLTISCDAPGKPVVFTADVWARHLCPDTDKTMSELQSMTVGADPSAISTAILTWAGVQQINIGGAANWYPKSWSVTIDNHLEREYGNVVGADSNKYHVTYALNEGIRDIIYEATLWSQNETYTNAKINNTAVTSVTVPLDVYTLTLSTGYFEANDLPELKHDLMDETVKIRFKSLSVA